MHVKPSMTRPPMPGGGKKMGKSWVMVCPVALAPPTKIDTGWAFPAFIVPAEGELTGLALLVTEFKPAEESEPTVDIRCSQIDGSVSSICLPLEPGFSLLELSLSVVPGDSVWVVVSASPAVLYAQATLLFKASATPTTTVMVKNG